MNKPRLLLVLLAVIATALLFETMLSAKEHKRETSAARRQLIFPHDFHAKDQAIACDVCHKNARIGVTGRDDLLPGHSVCADCHDVQAATDCGKCHLQAKPQLSPRIEEYSSKFNHALHTGPAKLECTVCHMNLDSTLAPEQVGHLPRMADCMTCHQTRGVKTECSVCHVPSDQLKPRDHQLSWLTMHGAPASENDKQCTLCHKTDYCQKCHNGDPTSSPHPRDYMARHGQDAHLADLECSVCHDTRSFCVECHRRLNVLPSSHFKPGWVTTDGGDHTTEAGFDLENCMACHDTPNQTPVCARCHGNGKRGQG
jgi:hypothetical protein